MAHTTAEKDLGPTPDGRFRSRAFPGLWPDPDALLRRDRAAVMAGRKLGLAAPEHAACAAKLRKKLG